MRLRSLSLLFALWLLGSNAASANIIIVHAAVGVSVLNQTDLRALFTMRATRWPDQTPVHVVVLSDRDPLHREFVKSSLGMFPYQLRMIWDRNTFSGKAYPPITVPSREQMLKVIQQTPGAVGYLDAMPGALPEGVKVVEVN